MAFTLDNSSYHQIKTQISFWCKRGLNPKSLIQPSETLLVELTETLKKKKSILNYGYLLHFFYFCSVEGLKFLI